MSISLYMLIICRDVNAYARGNTVPINYFFGVIMLN